MRQVSNYRSRLARQENRQMAKQTLMIFLAAIAFLVFFFWVGIPSLINLAISLGNSKAASKFGQDVDTIPPAPPQLDILPVATSSSTIDIAGQTESGVTVYLYQNGTKAEETTADNQGLFSFINLDLNPGFTSFYVQSVDPAGNQSQHSSTQTVKYDSDKPDLIIEAPSNGKRFAGVTEQLIDVSGSTDPDATVFLNDRQLVVTGSGSFTTKYELKEGDNKLHFTAKDQAGNQTEVEIKVNYSR
jgi:hypothetical protein